jgi:hypothetical protein
VAKLKKVTGPWKTNLTASKRSSPWRPRSSAERFGQQLSRGRPSYGHEPCKRYYLAPTPLSFDPGDHH